MNEELVLCQAKLIKLGAHFRSTTLFKKSKVSRSINKIYGGVCRFDSFDRYVILPVEI